MKRGLETILGVWFSMLVLATAALRAGDEGSHAPPLSPARQMELTKVLESQLALAEKQVAAQPRSVEAYSRRGDVRFFLGDFTGALADYEKMVEMRPGLETSHWRRGIARFYAGKFKEAARQFEIYHTFDDVDRENGIWRFLSQTKAYGIERAREGLLKYKKDDREPFPSVYEMFAGRLEPGRVIEQIEQAELDHAEREKRRFYAHLYAGLYLDVQGKHEDAIEHLRRATANTWGPEASYGPQYMWHVGRVHYELLVAPKGKAKPDR